MPCVALRSGSRAGHLGAMMRSLLTGPDAVFE
jgi:hypothetical protein